MKERPILFSGPMVRAILDGSKTQTRRIGKFQKDDATEIGIEYQKHAKKGLVAVATYRAYPKGGIARWGLCECPYGVTGERIWVRQMYYQFGHWDKNGITKTGKQKWKFVPDSETVWFEAPVKFLKSRSQDAPEKSLYYRRLGRFMPKKYARIKLEITAVRVERLQEISEEDAKAEGIEVLSDGFKNYLHGDFQCGDARMSYMSLWESINGAGSWSKNPWVWVIEFKRV